MDSSARHHDIDWLRVLAIGLLLLFHISLVFQEWGMFIQSKETCPAMIPAIMLVSLWRIPLLFFISGMGLAFAARRRTFGMLMFERTRRILVPTLFGVFAIVPLHALVKQSHDGQALTYAPGLWHLWFLAYIYAYVLCWGYGLHYLAGRDNAVRRGVAGLLERPWGLYLFLVPFVLEGQLLAPQYFSTYIENAHGIWLGALAFTCGTLFVTAGEPFWRAVVRTRYVNLVGAAVLYLVRWRVYGFDPPPALAAVELMLWVYTLFGLGRRHLDRPGPVLRYLSRAAYPVYILHMLFQYLASAWVLPQAWSPPVAFLLITVGTFGGSLLAYELLVRRVGPLRPLFGLKWEPRKEAIAPPS